AMLSNDIITTVAGNGGTQYTGDGGFATNAGFVGMFGVACDSANNIYISTPFVSVIRKVDTNGIITTIAGNTDSGYSGDGVTATNTSLNSPMGLTCDPEGNLYVADQDNNRVRM